MLAYIKTNSGSLSVILNGKAHQVAVDNVNYVAIEKALSEKNEKLLETLLDIPRSLALFSKGKVEVLNGQVLLNGKECHNSITTRILEVQRAGLDFKPLACFLDNLTQNPSSRAVLELYEFLSHKNLPITEDGCFLSYKAVRGDWLDFHTGTINNSIGTIVEMERNEVDDERAHECSHGLHVGAMLYVSDFHSDEERHIIITKVNPRDVVSVPRDHKATKVRVCKYEVLCEYTGELERPVYTSRGDDYVPSTDDDLFEMEDEYEDDDYDDDYGNEDDHTLDLLETGFEDVRAGRVGPIDPKRLEDEDEIETPPSLEGEGWIPSMGLEPKTWRMKSETSESIEDAIYFEERKQLNIYFRSGSLYQYNDVPIEVAHGFGTAPSAGRYFIDHIKDKFETLFLGTD